MSLSDAKRTTSGVARRLAWALALVALPLASVKVHALGLEPLALGAARLLGQDATAAYGRLTAPKAVQAGLVSQDRVTIDLTALSLSAFGDAEEPTAR